MASNEFDSALETFKRLFTHLKETFNEVEAHLKQTIIDNDFLTSSYSNIKEHLALMTDKCSVIIDLKSDSDVDDVHRIYHKMNIMNEKGNVLIPKIIAATTKPVTRDPTNYSRSSK